MKIHRFYIPHIEISPENLIVTHETELIHQLKNVFRYKIGQIIHIFNSVTGEIEVEIYEIGKKDISFKYIRQIKPSDSDKGHKKQVILYMSIIKNSNFDLIAEKAVELNVSALVPVISERVIKNKLNYERLHKIVKEATEQSGRIQLMDICETVTLEEAIKNAKENSDSVYVGSTVQDSRHEYDFMAQKRSISMFIGPEGGFSEGEMSLFHREKVTPIRLGDCVLRAETAAIVACGLVSL